MYILAKSMPLTLLFWVTSGLPCLSAIWMIPREHYGDMFVAKRGNLSFGVNYPFKHRATFNPCNIMATITCLIGHFGEIPR